MTGVVAVTGATGFIGRRLVPRFIEAGWHVRALARHPDRLPPRRGLTVVPGSLEECEALDRLVEGSDVVVHCAGLVKATSGAEFHRVNVAGTARLAEAAAGLASPPRFILLSSLAARTPALSHYAASKRRAEVELERDGAGLCWTVLRPPAVYGPGDRATLGLFRQLRRGIAPILGARDARVSLIFVEDLAAAIATLLTADVESGSIFEVRDGCEEGYTWRMIAEAAARQSGTEISCWRIPRPVLYTVAAANVAWCSFAGRAPMLTPGKVRELYHPDWVCPDNPLVDRTSWRPAVTIDEGFSRTLAWYEAKGWL